MSFAAGVVGCSATTIVIARFAAAMEVRRALRLKPNVVDGMIFPLPDDPRWKRKRCTKQCGTRWNIGEVFVCDIHGLYVGDAEVDTTQADAYADRVLAAQRGRLALAAALDEPTGDAR